MSRNNSADRLGLILQAKLSLTKELWPGYELKRHQTGKSFKNRVTDCYHYIYMFKESSIDSLSYFQQICNYVNSTSFLPEQRKLQENTADNNSESIQKKVNDKSRKRKVHQLVEGHYEERVIDSIKSFQCKFCQKEFPSDQVI
jgi:UDP-2,3-diacylglucosamine pyrophosphatase LpxH